MGWSSTVLIPNSRAMAQTCCPLAPPNPTSAQPRGSTPRATDTSASVEPPTAEMPAVGATAPPQPSGRGASSRGFGEGVVSEKPLDEVVLEYLVENARKRKRRNQ